MSERPGLHRRLGLGDAVMVGLSSMIGAGIFSALAPAAAAARSGLLIGLVIAAVVAYCNAVSSARLAARDPRSGGAYVYGRERLGEFWGYLAGWSFVVGKTASCAAMALTVGAYAWPTHARAIAVASVVALTAVNCLGIAKSAVLTRWIVAVVLAVLAGVVISAVDADALTVSRLGVTPGASVWGVLQAGGLLFFAFAGYARIATLGEEVRDPQRTIPRAISIALALALAVYAIVAGTTLAVLGPERLASSAAPLTDVARASGGAALVTAVGIGGAVAAMGSLLSLILGVSRTGLAMARDGHLPSSLGAIHPRFGVPHRAEIAVGLIVSILAVTVDLRGAIGFSSFGVLVYYGIANASAWTLTPAEGRPVRVIPIVGALGCAALAVTLPLSSVATGGSVLVAGGLVYAVRSRFRRR
ncbi:MAG: APC family permease [Mycolicibacterium insubricum]